MEIKKVIDLRTGEEHDIGGGVDSYLEVDQLYALDCVIADSYVATPDIYVGALYDSDDNSVMYFVDGEVLLENYGKPFSLNEALGYKKIEYSNEDIITFYDARGDVIQPQYAYREQVEKVLIKFECGAIDVLKPFKIEFRNIHNNELYFEIRIIPHGGSIYFELYDSTFYFCGKLFVDTCYFDNLDSGFNTFDYFTQQEGIFHLGVDLQNIYNDTYIVITGYPINGLSSHSIRHEI